jgi:hypothetical protein
LTAEWKKYIKYNILQEMESLKAKEETQKEKKDSVQKFKLKDTIKLEILSPEQRRVKATTEVKDLITDTLEDSRKEIKWIGSRFT